MFKCCSLYSGSSGNSFLISDNNTNILIDAGVSARKILDALCSINVSINEINAILITHEHIDHTKSVAMLSLKYNIPVFATNKTWKMIKNDKIKDIHIFKIDEEFTINDLTILPFSTPHDAADPCGFKISNGKKSICIATDLGFVTPKIFNHFSDCSFLMLEANYDPNILKVSKYPYLLKQRINGKLGHLSNSNAGETIAKLAKCNLEQALLIHLSKENNLPELALTTVQEELIKNNVNIKNINVEVAPRNNPSKIFNII